MARPAPPADDGSPTRLVATMVGIVAILLLGSLAWSAVGALVAAAAAAGSALSSANSPPSTLAPAVAVTPLTTAAVTDVPAGRAPVSTAAAGAAPTDAARTPGSTAEVVAAQTPAPTDVAQTPNARTPAPTDQAQTPGAQTPTAAPAASATPTQVAAATATAIPNGRNPWILLPSPAPGTKIPPGQVVVEARGRGDAPITGMRLELDGAALPVALEQRSDSVWRGSASTQVAAGQHNVRASVTDAAGRTGSYRWSFSAAPAP